MDIRNEQIFLVTEDIPLSRIAKFFKPQDETTKAFLLEGSMTPYEGSLAKNENLEEFAKEPPSPSTSAKRIIAICTAPKGETLKEVLRAKAIVQDGWGYGTLGDWYRYNMRSPFPDGEVIFTPGTIYLDENSSEWFPAVSLGSDTSFLQRITKRRRGETIVKIFLKPSIPLMRFQAERRILVYRIVEEGQFLQPKKIEGPSQ